MKLLLSLMITTFFISSNLTSAQVCPTPQGSYRNSCTNCRWMDDVNYRCDCKKQDNTTVSANILMRAGQCDACLMNFDGHLRYEQPPCPAADAKSLLKPPATQSPTFPPGFAPAHEGPSASEASINK